MASEPSSTTIASEPSTSTSEIRTNATKDDEELMDSLRLVEDDSRAGQGSQLKQVIMQDQATSPIMIKDDASENNDDERTPDASNCSANIQTNDDTRNLLFQLEL
ncbi:unnamed protein product [Rhizophagus irregularis]|uniref:Uncharacterized protein n=1 Tax=Rhizophagus irregularis TaxID=588596 RepID=A0A915YXT8_9GLOM|nr:unnamed protein product [Rhizophagus irregularis]